MKNIILFLILTLLFLWNWKRVDENGSPLNWVATVMCGMAAFTHLLIMGSTL